MSNQDKFGEIAEDIYKKIQTIAPEAYEITVQKYITEAYLNILYMVIWISFAVLVYHYFGKKLIQKAKTDPHIETFSKFLLSMMINCDVDTPLSFEIKESLAK